MEITPMISTLEVHLLPDVEPTLPIFLRLHDPLDLEAADIQLQFDDSQHCFITLTEADFPSHLVNGSPLLFEISQEPDHILFADPNFMLPLEEELRLEIPVVVPPSEEVEEALPIVKPESHYLIARAIVEHGEGVGEEEVEEWITQETGEYQLLDALGAAVLEGDVEAMDQLEEILVEMENEHEEDPGAFEMDLQDAIAQVDQSGIHNLPSVETEAHWPANALNGSRITQIILAAYQVGHRHSPAQAMANVARVLCKLRPIRRVQMAYDAAVRAYNGDPRPIRSIPAQPNFPRGYSGGPDDGGGPRPPRGPKDGPLPPKGKFKPEIWPPRTVKNPPSPLDDFKKRCFWTIERYFCTFDFLRQLPFDPPESYIISSISANGIVCRGETVTLTGSGFGISGKLLISQGSGKREIPVNTWTDTLIEFTVPSWAVSGSLLPRIVYDTKTICGVIRPFYKVGNVLFMQVLQLESKLSVEVTGRYSTPPRSAVKLFRILQQGQVVRDDRARVKWFTKDATLALGLSMTDPNGNTTTVSTQPTGKHDFPAQGAAATEGLHTFSLDANNKCANSNQSVTADYFSGTKAKITGFTVDGNSNSTVIFNQNDTVPIAWSLVDANSFKLRIGKVGLKNSISTTTYNNPNNPIQGWQAENALVTLEAVGSMRDHQSLVTDSRQIRVVVEPKILYFGTPTKEVVCDQKVTFNYQTRNATKILLYRDGRRDRELNTANGSFTITMNDKSAAKEEFKLEVYNEMYHSGHPHYKIEQKVTVKYRPTFKKCQLRPQRVFAIQFFNGGQQNMPQATGPSKNIRLCYAVSQGNTSVVVPQLFTPELEVCNAPTPTSAIVKGKSNRWVMSKTSRGWVMRGVGRILPFEPNIGDKFEVIFTIQNANGSATCKCTITYYEGLFHHWFCIRRKSPPGAPRYAGVVQRATAWSEAEAKALAMAYLGAVTKTSITEKTHTATAVPWNGKCS